MSLFRQNNRGISSGKRVCRSWPGLELVSFSATSTEIDSLNRNSAWPLGPCDAYVPLDPRGPPEVRGRSGIFLGLQKDCRDPWASSGRKKEGGFLGEESS